MNELTGDANAAVVAAGLLARGQEADLPREEIETLLRRRIDRSSWWRPGDLPPDAAGDVGAPLPVWRPRPVDPVRVDDLSTAIGEVRPEPIGPSEFLRVRVESTSDVRELWALDRFGPVLVAPSFASRGALTTALRWRWPLRVGLAGAAANWLDDVRASYHHGVLYEAAVLSGGTEHEIAIVHHDDLADHVDALGATACVIVVGDGDAIDLMEMVDDLVAPVIAVGVAAPPAAWWIPLMETMAHDTPIDVAVASVRQLGVDAAIAGPSVGLDVTAPGRWLAAVAAGDADLEPVLDDLRHWDWSSEGGGASNVCGVVQSVRDRGGDPSATVPPSAGRPLGTAPDEAAAAPPTSGAADEDTAVAPSAPAPSGDVVPPEDERPGRFVHAVVVDDRGDRERLTLVADRENILRCWIGPDRVELAASSDVPVPELGRDVMLKVDLLIGRDVVASGSMLLPTRTTTRSSDCELSVPPMPAGVFAGELAFTVEGRMFELVEVTGVVLADGTDDAAMPPIRIKSLLSHREVIDFGGRSQSSMALDVTTHDGEIVIREFGPRSSGVYDLTGKTDLVRELMRRLYAAEKSLVRKDRHGFGAGGPDPEWTEIVRSMATHGWLLHRSLRDQGFVDPGERFEVVNRLPDTYVPLELVYDRGAPAADAVIDPACFDALANNADDCGRCHPFDQLTADERDANPRLCPYGFWSLGKIIERHDAPATGALAATTPTDAAHRLHHLDSVLAGWSSNLRAEDREWLETELRRGGGRVSIADDWTAWKSSLADGPTILLALPHHDVANGIGTLEIGSDNSLGLQRELELFVRTPAGEPGPVLILLGCETDEGGELGHPSFARAFAAHASVVIGTLSKVLGRHAAPFAERLVESLIAAQSSGGDVGRVLRDVRRSMFADGYLMALGVIALGDADWRLAEAA